MGCCKCCCITLLVVGVIVAISTGLFAGLFPYPSHSSCKVEWEIGESCNVIKSKLVNQIEQWSHVSCNVKQECGYELLNSDASIIRGLRITSLMGFVDRFNFTMEDQSYGCFVQGYSRSEASYAVIDFGFNYCNLKNLILGSHLDKSDPFVEHSANGICTMYSIAHCNLYG